MTIRPTTFLACAPFMLALRAAALPYFEDFDTSNHWYGGVFTAYGEKYYTNNLADPANDRFYCDHALRSTNAYSAPFAWQMAQGTHYWQYTCTNTVAQFSVRLARQPGSYPEVAIQYSNNGGATYTRLYSGTTILSSLDVGVYTQYVSPVLDVSPRPGRAVIIQIYKPLDAPLLIDDFEIDFSDPGVDTVYMVSPAPAVTGHVAMLVEYFTESLADGTAQVGYGLTSNNEEWTWLDTGTTNLTYGYGATSTFWLTSGPWYYAARWITDAGATTNYGWNDHGQVSQSVLYAAEYQAVMTSYHASTVWTFGQPDSTTPTQDVPNAVSYIALAEGLASNIPGDGECRVFTFPAARSAASNVVFATTREGRLPMACYCRVSRETGGVDTVDLQYSLDGAPWTNWLTNLPIPAPDAWYMLGATNALFDTASSIRVRAIAYGGSGGTLSFGELQFAAPAPEPGGAAAMVIGLIALVRTFLSCYGSRS
jgi:hypothetical protein